MSGLDDERLNAHEQAPDGMCRASCPHPAHGAHVVTYGGMGNYECACGMPTPGFACPVGVTAERDALLSSLAAVSADRDREAERADKAEALLTAYAVAYWSGMSFEAHSDILDWYTDAAMKAGQQ